MASRAKWNHEARLKVFTTLKERFGPYAEWESASYPEKGKQQQYMAFLQELANEIGPMVGKADLEASAVDNQVKWAITNSVIRYQNGYRNMVLNTAAALYSEFLTYRDLPANVNLEQETED